jgi:hypothetical protein
VNAKLLPSSLFFNNWTVKHLENRKLVLEDGLIIFQPMVVKGLGSGGTGI